MDITTVQLLDVVLELDIVVVPLKTSYLLVTGLVGTCGHVVGVSKDVLVIENAKEAGVLEKDDQNLEDDRNVDLDKSMSLINTRLVLICKLDTFEILIFLFRKIAYNPAYRESED